MLRLNYREKGNLSMLKEVEFNYKPEGVCSKILKVSIEQETEAPKGEAVIKEVKFFGGCPGNAIGLGAAIKGRKVAEVIDLLKGIECGIKGTSCPDQAAKALEEWVGKED